MAKVSIRHDVGGPAGTLAKREPFDSHGAMTAIPCAPAFTGRLPAEWASRYRDGNQSPGIVYTVRSYATPIAWALASGEITIPEVSYSITTTRHQNLCRAWLT